MSKILAIARTTFYELVRSKVLYSVLFFSVLLLSLSAFFGTVTIGDRIKVIKDFGLFSLSLFSVAFATISGATLLAKELSKKTIYNILAKSVTRSEFVWGKYIGMCLTALTLALLLSLALLIFLLLFDANFELAMIQACIHICFELFIVCACAIFFSSIVITPTLNGLFTFMLFLAGRSRDYLLTLANSEGVIKPVSSLLRFIYWLLPPLDIVNISNGAVYGQSIPASMSGWCLIYSLAYSAILLLLATTIFSRREFN
jgi:ABC-type transport system involved in multi-copper enzyme maturation permease subunit